MKVTLEIPDTSGALNIVVLFQNDCCGDTFSSHTCIPYDGLVMRRDDKQDGSFEEVCPDAGIE